MTHTESRLRNVEIIAARKAGESVESLAARHGLTQNAIRNIVRGLAMPRPSRTRPPRFPTAREKRMAAAYRNGETLAQIGAAHGVTRERVRQILVERFGITRMDGGAALKSFRNTPDRLLAAKAKSDDRERRCLAKWGMSREQYLQHVAEWGNSADSKSPIHKFVMQHKNANRRGVLWEITFAQWWALWVESGHWADRGRGKGYCMARYGDSGPYSVTNVYICTVGQNFSDSYLVDHPNRKRSRGFSVSEYPVADGHRYMVTFTKPMDKQRYGKLPSRAAAEAFALEKLAA